MLTQYWRLGNIWYFAVIALVVIVSFFLYHHLKEKNKEEIYKFLYKLTLLNLAFHFLRLIFPPYVLK